MLLPQVNGIFRPSSQGFIWESRRPLCSSSPKTTTTEGFPDAYIKNLLVQFHKIRCFHTFPELNRIVSSKLATGLLNLIVELERDFLFVFHRLLCFDVALYLSHVMDLGDRF